MADPRELRNKRLSNEYRELMRISGSVIHVVPVGNAPYETYKVTFNIRTIVGPAPLYCNQTVCTLAIPPNYPDGAPSIAADKPPYPWHINWFQNGRWCVGGWNKEESLVSLLHRCARTLQFDPGIANPDNVANRDAMPFWDANRRNRRVMPSDTQALPIPDAPKAITISARQTPKIVVSAQADKPRISILGRDGCCRTEVESEGSSDDRSESLAAAPACE